MSPVDSLNSDGGVRLDLDALTTYDGSAFLRRVQDERPIGGREVRGVPLVARQRESRHGRDRGQDGVGAPGERRSHPFGGQRRPQRVFLEEHAVGADRSGEAAEALHDPFLDRVRDRLLLPGGAAREEREAEPDQGHPDRPARAHAASARPPRRPRPVPARRGVPRDHGSSDESLLSTAPTGGSVLGEYFRLYSSSASSSLWRRRR